MLRYCEDDDCAALKPCSIHKAPMSSSVKTCPMCRVPATEAHLRSDWHLFNEKTTAEGKTPMAENLYEQFEKSRFAGGSSNTAARPLPSPAAQVPDAGSAKNVNQWHWEERNMAAWTFERMTTLLKEAVFPSQGSAVFRITNVKDIEGDAYFNVRKGKLRLGFELKCKLEWEGELKSSDGASVIKATGKAVIADIDDSTDEDSFASQISGFTLDKPDEKGGAELLSFMKKQGPKVLAKQMQTLIQELRAKKDEK